MSDEEVRALANGVYLIRWNPPGGQSVAAIGRNRAGAVWLAPANWLNVPAFDHWHEVDSATLLCLQRDGSPDDLTGMLLAALLAPTDATALRALQDCISERVGPPQAKYNVKPLEWRQIRPAEDEEGEWWTASTVFGSFDVERDVGNGYRWRYCIDEYYDEGTHDCDSIADGKYQAEFFYRERLAPALATDGAVA
jgi:hypothetical protein